VKEELKRVKYVTRYYGMLQGLKAVPFGMVIISLALRDAGLDEFATPLLFVAVVLFFVTDRFYDRRFGRVQQSDRTRQVRDLVLFLVGAFLVIALENMMLLPFSLIGTAVAMLFFVLGIRMKTYYYLPLGLALLAASFLPWYLRVPLTDPAYGSLGLVLLLTLGGVMILAGLLDHWRLMKVMRPVEGGLNGAAE
jgi:hypothetical protein